jgi:uncharacterized membrane protein YeaQ/YmgE (transglycosylase-associated protein family)
MSLEMFVTFIIVGLVTGWLSSLVMDEGGHGRVWDLILGLAGSGAASTAASALAIPPEAGTTAMAVAACIGAAFVIVLQRKIWPSRTLKSVRATQPDARIPK